MLLCSFNLSHRGRSSVPMYRVFQQKDEEVTSVQTLKITSSKMAEKKHTSKSLTEQGGPEEVGGSVKNKTVSSSTAVGGSLGKRPARDESRAQLAHPKAAKPGFSLDSAPPSKKPATISIKLGASKPKEPTPAVTVKKSTASVFNEDDDSEPEEMPPEAKMRMKNIGRETPTSAGPNSFNKGKQGFSDHQKLWERKLKSQAD
ncbi:PEST proteolytic signal-containing nuclear protein isoform X3 [Denticeps clupeoides]|uniref:PEST proteolytic signal-containing nuclear protein isoform X3 n=1 Tax=Denticeps clupeoides TaxID=299321 RepID=UPI0010A2CE95|nr:PEST proteolytic signal-containing nuclear protein isoform X3 [Denticeps clupeoides]